MFEDKLVNNIDTRLPSGDKEPIHNKSTYSSFLLFRSCDPAQAVSLRPRDAAVSYYSATNGPVLTEALYPAFSTASTRLLGFGADFAEGTTIAYALL